MTDPIEHLDFEISERDSHPRLMADVADAVTAYGYVHDIPETMTRELISSLIALIGESTISRTLWEQMCDDLEFWWLDCTGEGYATSLRVVVRERSPWLERSGPPAPAQVATATILWCRDAVNDRRWRQLF